MRFFKRREEKKEKYSCAKCGVKWDWASMPMLEALWPTPGSEDYAGKCSKCGHVFCAKCAIFKDEATYLCPECKVPLK
jgi:predicted RNA-binding Zn-ribbon protein involved in translation (DUF1610 family)